MNDVDVKKDIRLINGGDYSTTEEYEDGTKVKVDWYREDLLEQWTDEPMSWWEMEGIGDDGSKWEATGEGTGDFGLNHVEIIEIEDVELIKKGRCDNEQ
ncbi:MAG: hypothetical protein H8D94_01850 [Candidatus Pelagibacter sp.]|nr:hypothetical protein [Candidatus Pelagibacter sp.]